MSVGLSARFLSNRGCGRYQMWICWYVQRALGTARVWSGVVEEQHVYGRGPKIIYRYYTRCALIRDRQPTGMALAGFAYPAETEATCVCKVFLRPSDGSIEICKSLYNLLVSNKKQFL